MRPALLLSLALLFASAGCVFNTHGNRRDNRPMLTRASELRKAVGRAVTLVGTARAGDDGGATLDLRGGSVELPAYAWPAGFVGQPVMVTGTLFADESKPRGAERVYRLGEVESAQSWSR